MSDQQDFVIENGVLKKYNGPGGEVVIPAGVEKIGSNAFQHCISMSGIALPDSVTEIGGGAFQSCTGLTQIVLPDGVTKIGSGAFFHCTGLTQIALPSSVTEIEASTFQDCTSLPEITLPDRLTEIGAEAFCDCTSLTSLTIPDSVTKVGGNAFAGTPWLAQQKQNNKIVYVGQCVVACRKDLSKANIREGTKQICAEAFKDCSGLREIILPVDVTEIGIFTSGGPISDDSGWEGTIMCFTALVWSSYDSSWAGSHRSIRLPVLHPADIGYTAFWREISGKFRLCRMFPTI